MVKVKKGDRVKIDFTGKLKDGTVIDTTLEHEDCSSDDCGCENGPWELTIGAGEFFVPIEDALIGMAVGEQKSVIIPPEEAFGEYQAEKILTVDRDQLPEDLNPEVDQTLELTDEDDESIIVTVTEVADKTITLDANHPFAGEQLSYDFTLVEIL